MSRILIDFPETIFVRLTRRNWLWTCFRREDRAWFICDSEVAITVEIGPVSVRWSVDWKALQQSCRRQLRWVWPKICRGENLCFCSWQKICEHANRPSPIDPKKTWASNVWAESELRHPGEYKRERKKEMLWMMPCTFFSFILLTPFWDHTFMTDADHGSGVWKGDLSSWVGS